MATTWIVIADRSRCKIVQLTNQEPVIVAELEDPRGRLPLREIDTDAPGSFRTIDGARRQASPVEREIDHQERVFARRVCDVIDTARVQHRFDHLALICAPGFLGVMRVELPKACQRMIVSEVAKDLVEMEDESLLERAHANVADALRQIVR